MVRRLMRETRKRGSSLENDEAYRISLRVFYGVWVFIGIFFFVFSFGWEVGHFIACIEREIVSVFFRILWMGDGYIKVTQGVEDVSAFILALNSIHVTI